MESHERLFAEAEVERDYPKLLYATNKLSTDRNFIIRTVEPRFIAEVTLFTDPREAHSFLRTQGKYSEMTTIKKRIVVVSVKEFWDNPDDYEPRVVRLATKRLAGWYKAQFLESIKRINERGRHSCGD